MLTRKVICFFLVIQTVYGGSKDNKTIAFGFLLHAMRAAFLPAFITKRLNYLNI